MLKGASSDACGRSKERLLEGLRADVPGVGAGESSTDGGSALTGDGLGRGAAV